MRKIVQGCFMLIALILTYDAFATTKCQKPHDWRDAICNLKPTPHKRCVKDGVSQGIYAAMCDGVKDGNCKEIPGGCFGNFSNGEWFPTSFMDGSVRRCQCGCFADRTLFLTQNGTISGKTLIKRNKDNSFQLASADYLDGSISSYRPIENIVWGPEKKASIQIKTNSRREIILTSNHPVVIGDSKGDLKKVVIAKKVKSGEFLVDEDGVADQVNSVQEVAYSGDVVNFTVTSNNSTNHIIVANGLKMGDNAWQQLLASQTARLMVREDILKELAAINGN